MTSCLAAAEGLLRHDLNILGLDAGEDLITFVEIRSVLAIIGDERSESEISLDGEGEFIDGAFEDFHADAAGKGIVASGIAAMEADFFLSQGKKDVFGGAEFWLADMQFKTAFEAASQHAGVGGEDLCFNDICLADE